MGAARPHWRLRRCVSRQNRRERFWTHGVRPKGGGQDARRQQRSASCPPSAGKQKGHVTDAWPYHERDGRCAPSLAPAALRESNRVLHPALPRPENKKAPSRGLFVFWRRERDSNPRRAFNPYSLSRGALSTTQPSLRNSRFFESGAGSALTRGLSLRMPGTAGIRPAAHTTQTIGPGKA